MTLASTTTLRVVLSLNDLSEVVQTDLPQADHKSSPCLRPPTTSCNIIQLTKLEQLTLSHVMYDCAYNCNCIIILLAMHEQSWLTHWPCYCKSTYTLGGYTTIFQYLCDRVSRSSFVNSIILQEVVGGRRHGLLL